MTDDLSSWAHAVDTRIDQALQATERATAPAGDASREVLAPVRSTSTGGKRLRAMLLIASHAAHRGKPMDRAVGVAAALELFQTAALIHDDLIDASDTRRGAPAAHRAFAALHSSRRWTGASADFGAAGAILAGDLALMATHRALDLALTPPAESDATVRALFHDMEDLVTAGQYLDMRIASHPLGDLGDQREDITQTMRSKTASYSAEFPLALGAAIAGASDEAIQAMRDIGVPLGIAFQLRDDVLGLTGAPQVTGKPAGDDVREGKRTLIAHHAWTHATADARATMERVLGDRGATDNDVAEVIDIMRATGALDTAERMIADLAGGALEALASSGLEPQATATLQAIFARAVDRAA